MEEVPFYFKFLPGSACVCVSATGMYTASRKIIDFSDVYNEMFNLAFSYKLIKKEELKKKKAAFIMWMQGAIKWYYIVTECNVYTHINTVSMQEQCSCTESIHACHTHAHRHILFAWSLSLRAFKILTRHFFSFSFLTVRILVTFVEIRQTVHTMQRSDYHDYVKTLSSSQEHW